MKIDVMIEMPRFTRVKYEIKNGRLLIDRILDRQIPRNYGFILGTDAPDGDPLDIFLLDWPGLQSRSIANAKIIGAFKCLDNGVEDHKIIGCISEHTSDYTALKEIELYLKTYKKGFKVLKYVGRTEAERIYRSCKNT